MEPLGSEDGDEAPLEASTPLDWVGADAVDARYIRSLINRMRACARSSPDLLSLFGMSRAAVVRLLSDARAIFSREETLEMVEVPNTADAASEDVAATPDGVAGDANASEAKLVVFGDLHGDLFSFLKAIGICGLPSAGNKIVIAGDMVDRGCWGVELLIVIFALKCWRPQAITLIRGNHETVGCTSRYGFETECIRKYDLKTYRLFLLVMRELPLAVIVESVPPQRGDGASAEKDGHESHAANAGKKKKKKQPRRRAREAADGGNAGEPWANPPGPGVRRTLVVHGGLWRANHGGGPTASSLAIGSLRDLAETPRQDYDPEDSCAEDCLWSDPGKPSEPGVRHNTLRGAGIFYGAGAVEAFLKREGLGMIVRAHEGPDARRQRPDMCDMMEGWSCDLETPAGPVVTLFSSANYCSHGNKGAIAVFTRKNYIGMPDFVSYEYDGPSEPELFYQPTPEQDRPSTPRNSPKAKVLH